MLLTDGARACRLIGLDMRQLGWVREEGQRGRLELPY